MTNNENERTLATIEVEIESSRLETKAFNAPCHVLTALETKWPDPKPITIRAWDEEARRQALTLEVGAITDLIVELNPTTQGGYYRNLVLANANQLNQQDQQAYIDAYHERNKQRGGSSTAPEKAKATPAPTPVAPKPVVTPGRETSIARQVSAKDATAILISTGFLRDAPPEVTLDLWNYWYKHILNTVQGEPTAYDISPKGKAVADPEVDLFGDEIQPLATFGNDDDEGENDD